MRLIRGLHNLTRMESGCAATIGNFDGVHLGHQAVLGQLAERAAGLGLPTVVVTFEPQPQEYFAPEAAPPRLTRLREKLAALQRYSVDQVMCLRFNPALAALTAEQFVQQILIDGLNVKYLVVGDDFRFGRGREGDFTYLQQAGERHGFQVAHMHTFEIDGARVSSTRIRQALEVGEMQQAERLLGRPYRMLGRVAHGDKRGRTIGFPTANVFLHRHRTPVQGVFAVEVFGLDPEPVQGVANVGTRPTVDGTRSLLEINLFDFDQQIYGRYVGVDFLHKLRPEYRFESFDALKEQIARDVVEAKDFFARR
ncbi:riboflavin biosynthesis protein [Thiohalobacter sp. COW1]|uniref:Riboflavin biosynthesis protein n=1 Tax=Thiohalobacter thiocyanaticus TaxID=585455 RepID=A0A1Z4VNW4_9GAMM|nr:MULTISPECIES: bifunctional riboflavin kinase/FAD synthetase [Thiohalobacter]BAZ93307.1 FAD synthase [Thiohalobacter thiocyanaticus]BCO31651.1 riboflavin biosynthesis protein [Thiohalobacter sp. COW1]